MVWKLKISAQSQNSKSKPEMDTRNRISKLKLNIQTGNPDSKWITETEIETEIRNSIFESRLWNSNFKLLFETGNRNGLRFPLSISRFEFEFRISISSFDLEFRLSISGFDFKFRISTFDFEFQFRISSFYFWFRISGFDFVFGSDVLALRASLGLMYWPFGPV